MYTCAITGHRPTRFKFKYNENDSRCKRLKRRLREQFAELYNQGVRRFLVGGALGVDMWSGEILLKMKLEPEYSDIELVVVLPYPGHDERWDERSQKRLAFLIEHSTEHITVGQKAWRDSFIQRNRYLVDHADCLLAVYDDERSIRSGTGMTVNYARKKEVPIILIDPGGVEIAARQYNPYPLTFGSRRTLVFCFLWWSCGEFPAGFSSSPIALSCGLCW